MLLNEMLSALIDQVKVGAIFAIQNSRWMSTILRFFIIMLQNTPENGTCPALSVNGLPRTTNALQCTINPEPYIAKGYQVAP